MRRAAFKFKPFSRKQRMVLNWWTEGSPVRDMEGIIADGAIRAGKTVSMSLSFVLWAMTCFNGEQFIMAGKTVAALRRNVLNVLVPMLISRGFETEDRRGDNLLIVSRGAISNDFYVFGGNDERSQDLVQGITAAGAFFDEAALMPESFVNQATGRLSVDGSKMWFNCNPAGPQHWFKRGWIDGRLDKRLLYLHFTMDDNNSLTEHIKERYRSMYAGVFFQRYILGLWAIAEGLIYTMMDEDNLYGDEDRPVALYSTAFRSIAVDYGTTNPCVFLDVYDDGTTLWVDREYRWDSRSDEAKRSGNPQRTDAQYADDMGTFMAQGSGQECPVIVDPSAASFIAELRGRGHYVKPGDNEVIDGIRSVGALLQKKQIKIHRACTGLISEMQSYAWDDKAAMRGEEKPVKQQDHGPDALRYDVRTMLPEWRR